MYVLFMNWSVIVAKDKYNITDMINNYIQST